MKNKVYWSGIEYEYCNNDGLKGGFVYAFISAFDVRIALDKILLGLKSKALKATEIEFVSPYDKEIEWETLEQQEYYEKLFESANSSEELVFDDFYAYENE